MNLYDHELSVVGVVTRVVIISIIVVCGLLYWVQFSISKIVERSIMVTIPLYLFFVK